MILDPDAVGGEGERNVAPDGSASQPTTLNNFAASRAIDRDFRQLYSYHLIGFVVGLVYGKTHESS
ncbi:MAG: hypothetical protein L7V87_10595 [Verrucomicrobiales bacterium]|nr:hypothetical protein [Verrucomicrobiales bacterium]